MSPSIREFLGTYYANLAPSDKRDMRDPEELGKQLLNQRRMARHTKLSRIYDEWEEHLDVPNYNPEPVDHAATRRDELARRALDGDRFAAAILAGDTLAEDVVE